MNHKKIFLCSIPMFISCVIGAQETIVNRSNQQWFQYFNTFKLSEKWSVLSDAGYRFREGFRENAQYIIRTGIGYQTEKNIQFSAGFAHLGFFTSDRLNRLEFRPHQQVNFRQQYKQLSFGHRIRIEQRYFANLNTPPGAQETNFNFRFRYLFSVRIPLFKLSSSNPDKKVSIQLADEILLNAGREVRNRIFDQNRILITPTLHLNKNLNIWFRYYYLFASTATVGQFNQLNIYWVGIRQTIGRRSR